MRLQCVNILLFVFLIFITPSAFSSEYNLVNTTCANSTHLIVSPNSTEEYYQGCAYGCHIGECIKGEALGLNALFVLLTYLVTAIMIFGLAGKLQEEWEFTSIILYGTGGLIFFLGVFAALLTYPVNADTTLSTNINMVVLGLGQSIPWMIIFFIFLAIVLFIVRAIENFRKQATGE